VIADVFKVTEGGRQSDKAITTTKDFKTQAGLLRRLNKDLDDGTYILHLYHPPVRRFLGPVSVKRLHIRGEQPPLVYQGR